VVSEAAGREGEQSAGLRRMFPMEVNVCSVRPWGERATPFVLALSLCWDEGWCSPEQI